MLKFKVIYFAFRWSIFDAQADLLERAEVVVHLQSRCLTVLLAGWTLGPGVDDTIGLSNRRVGWKEFISQSHQSGGFLERRQ